MHTTPFALEGDQFDVCGRHRSPATLPGHNAGQAPGNKGRTYPPDPPTVAEVVQLVGACGPALTGIRMRALIVVLWRTGIRIQEALDLQPGDLDAVSGAVVIRRGKGGRRRVVGMDPSGWRELQKWLDVRDCLPAGPVFCVVEGPTAGRAWSQTSVRLQLHRLARRAGIRKRIVPHSFRHQHTCELAREGVRMDLIRRQLGHVSLKVTARYLESVAPVEVIDAIGSRKAPMVPALP